MERNYIAGISYQDSAFDLIDTVFYICHTKAKCTFDLQHSWSFINRHALFSVEPLQS